MSLRLPKHLFDALTAARLACGFVAGMDVDAYSTNVLVRSAVERQLEILGEACRRALDEDADLRLRIPDSILAVGLRNRIIHAYDRLEHTLVLETVLCDLPGLILRLQEELDRHPPP